MPVYLYGDLSNTSNQRKIRFNGSIENGLLRLTKVFNTLWEYITLTFRGNHSFCRIHFYEVKEYGHWACAALGCSLFLPSLFHDFFF